MAKLKGEVTDINGLKKIMEAKLGTALEKVEATRNALATLKTSETRSV
jgi:hypothetical protein